MLKSQVAKLLVYVQSAERRSAPDELWVEVWHEHLADVEYDVAMRAVRAHYAASGRSITVADVLSLAETLQAGSAGADPEIERAADRLGITASEYAERRESDPDYLVALEARQELLEVSDE